jgi:hypothetical protein
VATLQVLFSPRSGCPETDSNSTRQPRHWRDRHVNESGMRGAMGHGVIRINHNRDQGDEQCDPIKRSLRARRPAFRSDVTYPKNHKRREHPDDKKDGDKRRRMLGGVNPQPDRTDSSYHEREQGGYANPVNAPPISFFLMFPSALLRFLIQPDNISARVAEPRRNFRCVPANWLHQFTAVSNDAFNCCRHVVHPDVNQ